MGRLTASLLLLALTAAALGACGSGGGAELLPGTTASQITANLDEVEQLVGEGECIGAENSAAEIGTQVEELNGVDGKLKQALAEGVSRLTETVASQCEEAEPEEETEPTTTEPAEEEEEPEEKPKHEKPEKPEKPEKEGGGEEVEETPEGPTLPPPSNGKGEENGQGGGPPTETGGPSGGVGPGTPAEEE
jgi:septal ring-binding cell division protein DamX